MSVKLATTTALFAVLLGATAGSAHAAPGGGLTYKKTKVVPGLSLGVEYVTNAYLAEDNERSGASLNVAPHLSVDHNDDDLTLRATGVYRLRKFLDPDLANLDRFNNMSASLDAQVRPHAPIGFKLSDDFYISDRPVDVTVEEENAFKPEVDDATISRLSNELAGTLLYHPGPAFELGLGGEFALQDINTPPEFSTNNQANLNTSLGGGPVLQGRWKFFPRTSLVVNGAVQWFDWSYNLIDVEQRLSGVDAPDEVYGSYLAVPDGYTWRATAGLVGRLTEKISINAVGGYGQASFDAESVADYAAELADVSGVDPAEYDPVQSGFEQDAKGKDGVLASVALRYNVKPTQQISLGYKKDFLHTYFSNYIAYHYGYVAYKGKFVDALSLNVEAGYRLESIWGEVSRQDHVLRAQASLKYALAKWSDISLGGRWDERASLEQSQNASDYDAITAFLTVDLRY